MLKNRTPPVIDVSALAAILNSHSALRNGKLPKKAAQALDTARALNCCLLKELPIMH